MTKQIDILPVSHEVETSETMFQALGAFLDALDIIETKHGEVGDTAVREEVQDAIQHGFLDEDENYFVDGTFGMYTARGAHLVRSAVRLFIKDADTIAQSNGWNTREKRAEALVAATDIRKDAQGQFPFEPVGGYYAAYIAGMK